jgi:hypothetical protein
LHQAGTSDPIDLTDYSIRGQIRKTFSDFEPVASFQCDKLDAPAGKLNISLGAASTAALSGCKIPVDTTNYESADKSGQYRYDVEIFKGDSEIVYRAIQGIIYVDPEVTKP